MIRMMERIQWRQRAPTGVLSSTTLAESPMYLINGMSRRPQLRDSWLRNGSTPSLAISCLTVRTISASNVVSAAQERFSPLAAVYVITMTFPRLEIATKALKTRVAIVLPPGERVPKVLSKNMRAISKFEFPTCVLSIGTTINWTLVI